MLKNPKPGELYKHFKGNLYQIIGIATHSETGEELVIYQALYGEFKLYARPLIMFLSLVDRKKYKDAKQTYRFELVERENISTLQKETEKEQIEQVEIEENEKCSEGLTLETGVNKVLLRFLDAETCKEKIEVLQETKKVMNERLLDDIAVSLDLILDEESLEDKYDRILNFLRTRAKFERR